MKSDKSFLHTTEENYNRRERQLTRMDAQNVKQFLKRSVLANKLVAYTGKRAKE